MTRNEVPDPDEAGGPIVARHIRHALNATRFSMAGGKRLWQETAAQAELLYFIFLLIGYWLVGASLSEFGLLSSLFLVTVALEALNTSVEVLVDHLTNEFAEFARQAKDLGSFAVFCGLTLMTLYSSYVVITKLV